VSAPDDLGARFSSVLSQLNGRSVTADALFETLKLEALDWGLDHDIDTELVETQPAPATADKH
jgi:hypothetical protein